MKAGQTIIHDIRAFNRFYTALIGLLDGHLLDSNYSLAEVRVLYEINAAGQISATHIMAILNIDKGYLSRILKKLEKDMLIAKTPLRSDARVSLISLTKMGVTLFNKLNEASDNQIGTLISKLTLAEQESLASHMQSIIQLLKPDYGCNYPGKAGK